jgi:hypothetical protein
MRPYILYPVQGIVVIMKPMVLVAICVAIGVFAGVAVATGNLPGDDGGEKDSGGGGGDASGDACAGGNTSVTCDEGNEGVLSIPLIGAQFLETHAKHHWNMPSNQSKVVAVLEWSDTSWDLEFAVGIGDCPDSGEAKASVTGSTGLLEVEFVSDEDLSQEQWFIHVACNNLDAHRGESLSYSFTVTLYECGEC